MTRSYWGKISAIGRGLKRLWRARAILPQWRYWPAVPLAALVAVAVSGFLWWVPPEQQHGNCTHGNACEQSAPNADPRTAEERIADYNFGLEVFTGLLAAFSIIQLIFLLRADYTGRMAANAARDAADVAKKTSEDNLKIALSQIGEAQQSRILQHRPKLRVRNIVIKSPDRQFQAPIFARGFPVCGQFYVSNIGGVRAHVVESHCEVLWNVNGLPMERPYEGKDGNNPLPGKPTIAAGSNAAGIFDSGIAYDISGQIGVKGGVQVYVMGWIEYMDDAAIRRRTAFCRQFLHKEGSARFYPVDDPDYEYEE